MTMSDRIAILDGGELQQVGTPIECYHEPANRFVAGFLGEPSMNFFNVTLTGDTLKGDEFEYPLSEELRSSIEGTTDLVLGVRPEDIKVVGEPTGSTELSATIDVVEPHGDENAVHARFSGQTSGESFTVTVGGMRRLMSGQDVGVSFPEDAIHLFDAASGETIRNRALETVERVEEIGTT
jgi:multiple sugar transport system ATP-binding protein